MTNKDEVSTGARATLSILGLIALWAALSLMFGNCSGLPPIPAPPGPICTSSGQTCCYTWSLADRTWVKVPCEPPPDPEPSPSPSPKPTPPPPPPPPDPVPSPRPSPSPTPRPSPPPLDCPMGTGHGTGDECSRTEPVFLRAVNQGIDAAVAAHPDWFDLTNQRGAGGYYVMPEKQGQYHDAVCAAVRQQGLCCSVEGGYEEIAVKGQGANGNVFGEGYDILLGTGHIWRGTGSYQGTCRPAWFAGGVTEPPPPDPNPDPIPNSCPELVCLYAHVQNIVVGGRTVEQAEACERGCWVVLDSTPLFGRCNSNGRCNGEMHNSCDGGTGHTHSPDPSDPGTCTTYRKCEDPRGYTWRRVSGPETRWEPRNGDQGRGFQAKINTSESGTYVWEVCKDRPQDGLGIAVVAPPPDCTQVSFTVR